MIFTSPLKPQLLKISNALKSHSTVVVCYCALWCRTCVEFYEAFKNLSHERKELFLWVDIEDDPELLDDIDVEDFPTVLIQHNGENYFFGTILPHIQHLNRLIDAQVKPKELGPSDLNILIKNLLPS
ncbi:thioredoxin family protein [Taylorella equigenitalis]|uniref:Thioredoxin domain-containing protein n=3 Tax=Taylorella equigenitalis TaxID=29575 RepID=A0A654KFN8_TAYEM|nr:thioredoxin family protein [Taylorella equigenitalis]ADU91220.1 hypothetical protein TEQUI_0272 [Taylorella equigenitalis MCE9]AFN36323.1 putative thioredoxin [Taylorella equigenitalis ATCC 35865]ASY30892.1 thiol reductase thioredoxin [Taylorella equigenitalis]ASY38197.1 thioredoxin [Taylorella equigenitalis]ASY39724.1 thiol reductase thioredoxin [Taylorella equigenitalis]